MHFLIVLHILCLYVTSQCVIIRTLKVSVFPTSIASYFE